MEIKDFFNPLKYKVHPTNLILATFCLASALMLAEITNRLIYYGMMTTLVAAFLTGSFIVPWFVFTAKTIEIESG